MVLKPVKELISRRIPPNYSAWQTIEYTYQCADWVIKNNIPGDFVECGVAAGNNFAAMCLAGRHGHGFDSFEGIPWASENDTVQPGIGEINREKIGVLESSGVTVHSEDDVHFNMSSWRIKNYTLYKGWFQNTVKDFNKPISLLRLDGDLYESTIVCLEHLYPLLSKGGILIIDDWNLDGCVRAFNEYFNTPPKELFYSHQVKYFHNV